MELWSFITRAQEKQYLQFAAYTEMNMCGWHRSQDFSISSKSFIEILTGTREVQRRAWKCFSGRCFLKCISRNGSEFARQVTRYNMAASEVRILCWREVWGGKRTVDPSGQGAHPPHSQIIDPPSVQFLHILDSASIQPTMCQVISTTAFTIENAIHMQVDLHSSNLSYSRVNCK